MAQARQARAATGEGQEALIGGSTRVRGRVTGDGDLTVHGSIEGEISLRGDLTIADEGTAVSDVQAENVTVAGSLEGDIEAQGSVRLATGSRVRGNLRGATVVIEDGARFSGRIDCDFDLPGDLEDERTIKR